MATSVLLSVYKYSEYYSRYEFVSPAVIMANGDTFHDTVDLKVTGPVEGFYLVADGHFDPIPD